MNQLSSIKKIQTKAKNQESDQEDEKIIFANDGKQEKVVATPDQVLRDAGSETPLNQSQDLIQANEYKTAPQQGTVLNPIKKKAAEEEDEDYGVDQFEQEEKQIDSQNKKKPEQIHLQAQQSQKKQDYQDQEDQDYDDDEFQNIDDSKLQKDKTGDKKDDQDDKDEQHDNKPKYQQFSFKTPYSKDDDHGVKHQQQLQQPLTNNNESAQQQYEDDTFEAQGDFKEQNSQMQSDQYYEQQMAQSTSDPKIELVGQKKKSQGAVNQMLNQQSPPLIISQGKEAQLASDSEDNENLNDDEDEDQEEQINITKMFEMKLAVQKTSSKKINYYNNDDVANDYQLVSSHQEIMTVKDKVVTIPENSQGRFQLRFSAVSQPCQQQAVLFVLKNNEPWENILFQITYL